MLSGFTSSRRNPARVLIVGTTPLGRRLIEVIEQQSNLAWTIVGLVGERPAGARFERHPVLGPVDHLADLVERLEPEVIVVALVERRVALPINELLRLRIEKGLRVEDGVELFERLTGALPLDTLTPASIVFSPRFHQSARYRASARALSIVTSLTGLIVLAPVFALIALAVVIDSGGPVFFVQTRAGAMGRCFRLIKFRTMRCSKRRTTQWVRDNGERITRVGRWLRKFRLDELPQLVNVLRGDMSLVGPRPHPLSNLEVLRVLSRNLSDMTGSDIPYYALRSLVRPGITGWAQVRYGYANNFEEELEKLGFDLYYVKHQSFWLDLRILAETARVLVRGQDADLVRRQRPDRSSAGGFATRTTRPAA